MKALKNANGFSSEITHILPMTVSEFYDHFLRKNATFGFDDLDMIMKRKESIFESDWKIDGTRLLKSLVPLSGVPFISETRHHKLLTIKERNERKVFLQI